MLCSADCRSSFYITKFEAQEWFEYDGTNNGIIVGDGTAFGCANPDLDLDILQHEEQNGGEKKRMTGGEVAIRSTEVQ